MTLYKIYTHLRGSSAAYLKQSTVRQLTLAAPKLQQVLTEYLDNAPAREDVEWLEAKDYKSLPGPSRLGMLFDFLPGGKVHNKNMVDMNRIYRKQYGDIYLLKGMFGKMDMVFTYNPKDIETVYRNEGVWPLRVGLESFTYYRKVKRPEVFRGLGGLVSEQGKAWADVRNKVNPVLMKPQNVRQNLPQINQIATEFLHKLETLIDPATHKLKCDFHEELKMWAFESISYVALNTRMGLMTDRPDPNARKLADNMSDFFQYSFEYDILPSFWMYVETPGFKRLLRTYDNITEITTNYIDAAIKKFDGEGNSQAKSVLEKLCRLDKQVALVMAMDMLMAGIDTTSSAFVTILYHLARNPEKQALLREELRAVMPNANTPLTQANTINMPYLRACMKEALRVVPITPSSFRVTIKDLVLSDYKVPKGTGIVMGVMELSNTEAYFPRSSEYLPERWLKSGETSCPAAKSTNAFVYMPFGFGPRTCIGKRIAEMEIETLLAKLIRNYKVTWQGEEEMNYISNIILIPHKNDNFRFEPVN